MDKQCGQWDYNLKQLQNVMDGSTKKSNSNNFGPESKTVEILSFIPDDKQNDDGI